MATDQALPQTQYAESDGLGIAYHVFGAGVRVLVDLVAGSGIGFEERGTQQLKGVPGKCRLFRALVG